MDKPATQGVYFLGNDRVANWCIAFLESFRQHNPDLPLRMVPFNEQCERMQTLADKYRYRIHGDAAYPAIDQIGRRIHRETEYRKGAFRRLAAFWGEFDTFIYSDCDIVVLEPFDDLLHATATSGADLLCVDEDLPQVYRGAAIAMMQQRYGSRGFNSGFYGTRRGLFSLDDFEQLAGEAEQMLEGLNTNNADQPFINFCCDVRRVKIANFAQYVDGISPMCCVVEKQVRRLGQRYCAILPDAPQGKRLKFLHWAGYPLNGGIKFPGEYLKYRLRPEPLSSRIKWRCRFAVQGAGMAIVNAIRNATLLSRAYKRLVPQALQERVVQFLRGK